MSEENNHFVFYFVISDILFTICVMSGNKCFQELSQHGEVEARSQFLFISHCRQAEDESPRVIFTGFDDPQQTEILTHLGGTEASSADDCTVLVTDRVRRTCKFLSCVSLGIPIVSPDWLQQCAKENTFLNPWDFILSDSLKEKEFGFRLNTSLKAARAKRLLAGYTFMVTPSIKPPPAEMKGIVESCGARFLARVPSQWTAQSVVVTCNEDQASWPRYRGATHFVTSEFVLIGALRQTLNFKQNVLTP